MTDREQLCREESGGGVFEGGEMKIYHYCAITQLNDYSIKYSDGILSTDRNFKKEDDYPAIVKIIANRMDAETITILSLTVRNVKIVLRRSK
jgi:hypothetical protein